MSARRCLGTAFQANNNKGGQKLIIAPDDTPTVMLAALDGLDPIPLRLVNNGALAACPLQGGGMEPCTMPAVSRKYVRGH